MTRTAQEALAQALHDYIYEGEGAEVDGIYSEGAPAAILAALPEETREDGHKGHWKLTLWWDPEPAPVFRIEGEDEDDDR